MPSAVSAQPIWQVLCLRFHLIQVYGRKVKCESTALAYQGFKAATSSANPALALYTTPCAFYFQRTLDQHESWFCSLEEAVKSLKHKKRRPQGCFSHRSLCTKASRGEVCSPSPPPLEPQFLSGPISPRSCIHPFYIRAHHQPDQRAGVLHTTSHLEADSLHGSMGLQFLF